jgi:hypothetical protein
MTFAEMQDTLVLWLNREGFTTLVDQSEYLIAMGQRRIHRECDLKAMEELITPAISANTLAVPADLIRIKDITLLQGWGNSEVLAAPISEVMRDGVAGTPTTYTLIGSTLYFGPAPDQEYTAQLVYYKRLPILSSTDTTNWISENEPELLLFAALMEASMFLKDDARAQMWEARFMALKESLAASETRSDKPYGSLRVRTR